MILVIYLSDFLTFIFVHVLIFVCFWMSLGTLIEDQSTIG